MRIFWVVAVLVRTALRGLQSSAVTSVAAAGTIAIALVLVGAFALIAGNMQGLLQRFGEELQVVAYLESDIDAAAAQQMVERVATVEGVQEVEWVSPERALERLRESLGGGGLLEGLEENPLPASLEITLAPSHRTPEGIAILVEAVDGLPGVDELAHGQDWVEGYSRVLVLVRSAAVGLGGVLALAALLIVANTIRLAVYAREDELAILSLVGASRTFVRVPFLLEGTLQGAVGGLVALGLLYAAFIMLVPEVQYGLELFLGSQQPRFFAVGEAAWLVAAGAGLGMCGSGAAMLGWRA
ncbi:MAG: permease-like cell division protein FtsX [Proteobacteria bacterium]|nr:permease-like cell division protein FtsX [Pseudomonadota bacterium]